MAHIRQSRPNSGLWLEPFLTRLWFQVAVCGGSLFLLFAVHGAWQVPPPLPLFCLSLSFSAFLSLFVYFLYSVVSVPFSLSLGFSLSLSLSLSLHLDLSLSISLSLHLYLSRSLSPARTLSLITRGAWQGGSSLHND